MTRTEDLIEALARDSGPVRRLRGPWTRTGGWLACAGLTIGAVVAVDGVCPNLAARLADPLFAAGLAAAGVTGALAGTSAFLLGLPDRSRLWALLPAPSALVWLGALGFDCLGRWTPAPEGAIQTGDATHCLCVFLAVSGMIAAALLWMLRPMPLAHGRGVTLLAGLAVAGLGVTGFTLTRTFDTSALMLTGNLGMGALATLVLIQGWGRAMAARAG